MVYPQVSGAFTSLTSPEKDFFCYRYLNNSDNTDAATLSSIQLSAGFSNPLKYAYIVYYNKHGNLQKIKWSAIGI
jgi:hypothetical protein